MCSQAGTTMAMVPLAVARKLSLVHLIHVPHPALQVTALHLKHRYSHLISKPLQRKQKGEEVGIKGCILKKP